MWSKLDDKFHSHSKARRAGFEALGLWVVSLSYCGDQLTDGFVPEWFVETWPQGREAATQLVKVGLWEVGERGEEAGWLFHDYLDFNPDRAKVIAGREATRERQRVHRERRQAEREAAQNVVQMRQVTGTG